MSVLASRWCRVLAMTAAVLMAHETFAAASTISLGSRILINATTFALPIEITGAVNVSTWTFDLTYDPTDVQVNSACDPFSGDIYCDFVTGPVTEGNFFASGFSVLTPGILELDPITFAQTGHLIGVADVYSGPPPSPSGDGVLAYVEFTQLGTGDSPIMVNGNAPSDIPVPEPCSLVLLTTGLFAPRLRRALRHATQRQSQLT